MIYLLDASFINYSVFLSSVFKIFCLLFLSFYVKLPKRKDNVFLKGTP